MALDTREKRASVLGVGRPWYRTKLPGANDAAWRAASGNAYAGVSISAAVPGADDIAAWIMNHRRLLKIQ